jgi:hypothetical protein
MAQTKVTALWNGGWDTYIVDLDDLVEDTTPPLPDTRAYQPELQVDGRRYVRLYFVAKYAQVHPGKAARMIDHLGGGD